MLLTADVVKDLLVVLREVGFSKMHAEYVIYAASQDQTWAVGTVEKAILKRPERTIVPVEYFSIR